MNRRDEEKRIEGWCKEVTCLCCPPDLFLVLLFSFAPSYESAITGPYQLLHISLIANDLTVHLITVIKLLIHQSPSD